MTALASPFAPLFQGFLLCASIIIALGPQNMFILRQGLRRQHLFVTAFFSTLADVVLIALAIGGMSAIIAHSELFHALVTMGGAAFLLWCGGRSLVRAIYYSGTTTHNAPFSNRGIAPTIISALCFSFLNPAAYLDTLVIIGSKSLLFSGNERVIFGVGAIAASTCWFFMLVYGAGRLAPILKSSSVWRAMDFISGGLMVGIALLTLCVSL
jgi:L-lysine exporter family protein LysE/ArgO